MEPIVVKLLGQFDIIVDGNSSLPYIGNSPKGILLLKYLLLNRGKVIPVSDLIDMFWADPEKNNPESALKTMVSRLRSSLSKASPRLQNCIISEKKAYMWNAAIPCEIDVFQFEALYRELEEETEWNHKVREKYIQALDLYEGDLSYAYADEDWVVSRSLYLHHLYLKIVYKFIENLKAENDYEMIIHVCRIALDIDTFDEALNFELMNALKEGGQNSAALMQYHHITSAYYKYLGIEPSPKILNFYKALIKADLSEEASINNIRDDLKNSGEHGGAFICDYSIFRDIYQLQLRGLERQRGKMFLSLISVSNPLDENPMDPMTLDGIMRELLEILKKCLRKGDTIARYSSNQYAILLPMISYSDGNTVIRRVKKMFYNSYSETRVRITFQFGRIDDPVE